VRLAILIALIVAILGIGAAGGCCGLAFCCLRFEELAISRRRRNALSPVAILPKPADLLLTFKWEFDELLAKASIGDQDKASESDRARFGFDEQEWREFLDRLGFDESDSEQS
jgi:hypothetical protein